MPTPPIARVLPPSPKVAEEGPALKVAELERRFVEFERCIPDLESRVCALEGVTGGLASHVGGVDPRVELCDPDAGSANENLESRAHVLEDRFITSSSVAPSEALQEVESRLRILERQRAGLDGLLKRMDALQAHSKTFLLDGEDACNDEGAYVNLGNNSKIGPDGSNKYYCGRFLDDPDAEKPATSFLTRFFQPCGTCGPNNGAQCESCKRFQKKTNLSHRLGHHNWICEVLKQNKHTVEETVWEASVVMFMPHIGHGGTAMVALALFMNVWVQVFFLFSIGTGLLDLDSVPDKVDIERWRETVAHHASFMDEATGHSLAWRVCNGGPDLQWSNLQQDILSAAAGFTEASLGPIPNGMLLNVLVQFTWTFLVGKEIQNTMSFMLAVGTQPRGKTKLAKDGDEFEIEALSTRRVMLVTVVGIVRILVAAALLVLGSLWLAHTTDISEMLLNAAGLGFILETDEVLFQTIIPVPTQTLVHKLRPLTKTGVTQSRHIAGVGISSACVVVLASLYFCAFSMLPLTRNYGELMELQNALCLGDLDFVWGRSPTGEVWSTSTASHSSAFLREAVHELVWMRGPDASWPSQPATLSRMAPTQRRFEVATGNSMANYGNLEGECRDKSLESPANAAIAATLQMQLGSTWPLRCADVASRCQEPGLLLLRFACPEICGCREPRSGLFANGADQGCPRIACVVDSVYRAELDALHCQDPGVEELRATEAWVELAGNLTLALGGSHRAKAEEVSRAFLELGCEGISWFEQHAVSVLGSLWRPCTSSAHFASLRAFCPETCGCAETKPMPDDCPTSCRDVAF